MSPTAINEQNPSNQTKPSALAPSELAQILKHSGFAAASEATVAADLAAGAPVNPDGTINLIHYTAWLAREAAPAP